MQARPSISIDWRAALSWDRRANRRLLACLRRPGGGRFKNVNQMRAAIMRELLELPTKYTKLHQEDIETQRAQRARR